MKKKPMPPQPPLPPFGQARQDLFDYLSENHNLHALESEMDEIERLAIAVVKARMGIPPDKGFQHPTTLLQFEKVYNEEYLHELEDCDKWIKWCEERQDTHGKNFHQGLRAAHIFNNIKMCQLIRVLKQEPPNRREV